MWVLYLNTVKKISQIVLLFMVFRVGLFFIGIVADNFFVYAPSFPYADGILDTFNLPRWLYSWAGFDGVHYLTIMSRGYRGADLIQAFFPVYPYLTKFVNFFFNNYLVTSLVVSNVSFVILLYVWHGFVEQLHSRRIANWSTLSLLLFPTSFFFVATYTESIFMIFVIGAFWATLKKKYWVSALCIALASATKITGILLIPAILFEIMFAKIQWGVTMATALQVFKKNLNNWSKYLKSIAIVSLGSLGLFAYMFYLYKEFGDPLLFFSVQEEFGGGVRQQSFVSYPQVIWRYIKILVTARPFDLKYFSYVQDIVVAIFGLVGILFAVTKTRVSFILFALLAFFLPTMTGTFSSMPRYILVCFPIFILLGIWAENYSIFRKLWFIGSGILLIINTILFIQGYWVA